MLGEPAAEHPPPLVIVLKNVAYTATSDGLCSFLASLGTPPLSVDMLLRDGQACGVAFARFATPDAAATALVLANDAAFHGRRVKAEFKRPSPSTNTAKPSPSSRSDTLHPVPLRPIFDPSAAPWTPVSGDRGNATPTDTAARQQSPDLDDGVAVGGGVEDGDGDVDTPARSGPRPPRHRTPALPRVEGHEYRLRPADGSSWRQREARARAETGGNASGGDVSPAPASPAPPHSGLSHRVLSGTALQALATANTPIEGGAAHVRYAKGPPAGDPSASRGFVRRSASTVEDAANAAAAVLT